MLGLRGQQHFAAQVCSRKCCSSATRYFAILFPFPLLTFSFHPFIMQRARPSQQPCRCVYTKLQALQYQHESFPAKASLVLALQFTNTIQAAPEAAWLDPPALQTFVLCYPLPPSPLLTWLSSHAPKATEGPEYRSTTQKAFLDPAEDIPYRQTKPCHPCSWQPALPVG